jgi:isopropylmalate/homocitrate/citramalate synthase
MELLDTTLREGEQCYGVFFSIAAKVEIARLLDRSGIDFIEVGHPAAAPSLAEAARQIAALGPRARLLGHARLNDGEIRSVRDLGLAWIGLFSGINLHSLDRYGLGRSAAIERIRRSIGVAKDMGLAVRFTCEDASRTSVSELTELYGLARESGADRLGSADTGGIDTPERLQGLRRGLGEELFRELHYHFHDDGGRAFDNVRTVMAFGARCIDASILGVGERMGLVPLERMVPVRDRLTRAEPAVRLAHARALRGARTIVESAINRRRYEQRRFAHKSGIHIHGICRDPASYEGGDRAAAGDSRLVVLSKLIGRSGLRHLLVKSGFDDDNRSLARLLRAVKSDDRLELADPAEIKRYLDRCGARPRLLPRS